MTHTTPNQTIATSSMADMPLEGLILPPLALYIHIPWCVRKCPYCDFNSHKAEPELPEAEYVDALIADLNEEVSSAAGRPLQSIFIGGGTPSLFSAAAIGRVLDAAQTLIGFAESIEITMEANPGTFEQEKFHGFRSVGVNRLSIGIQSFADEQLKKLGRIHGREEALNAVKMARIAGFDNINLDLMHGLPGQTPETAQADLQQAIDLDPEHISWYQLTIEPNTEFYSRPPTLPIEDALADIQELGEAQLAAAGYRQYEVSAYARQGAAAALGEETADRRSRHNLNYWRFGDYIGIGAGAHGKTTQTENQQLIRRRKTRLPAHYLEPQRGFCASEDKVSADDLPLEFMMNALRLCDGVPSELFTQRAGLPLSALEPQLSELRQRGLIEQKTEQLQTTDVGQRYLNEVLAQFM